MQTPFPVTGLRVPCDGGGGALGHPRVWLTLDEDTRQVRCPYCSRLYVEDQGQDMDIGS
ncbi:MAG: zinc-finger domain-containing protein [Candidatus Puniceispirillales bacterium]|nr:zinc-finger domain-containing protein [Pseudomonadota bacterium]